MGIRRVSYKTVQDQIADNLGWDANNLHTDEQSIVNRGVNRWAQFGWDAFFWPEWTVLEKRVFRQYWDSATSWAAKTEVYHRPSKKYYCALQANTNQEPATGSGGVYTTNLQYWGESASQYSAEEYSNTKTYVRGERAYYPSTDKYYQLYAATSTGNLPTDTTKWGELIEFERNIDYEQSWETTVIGDVKKVWDRNPRKDTDACEIDKILQNNGVRVLGTDPVVYVEFRKRAPSWTGTTWSAATTYAKDAQVWDPTQGDYYKSLQNANTNHAVTDTAWWERIDFPYVLSKYVIAGVYAAVMGKTDGQQEKYPSEMEEAYQLLIGEFDKIERQQAQSEQLNVRV
jgi:hypothetical protein